MLIRVRCVMSSSLLIVARNICNYVGQHVACGSSPVHGTIFIHCLH